MRRASVSMILAVGLLLAATGVVLAATSVTDVVVSRSADAGDAFEVVTVGTGDDKETVYVVPAGVDVAYIVFDYKGASSDKITVVIDGPGLSNLYRSPQKTYTDSGTDSVPISGAALFAKLTSWLAEEGRAVRSRVGLVQNQSYVQELLLQISGSVNRMNSALDLVGTLPPGSVPQDELFALETAVERLDVLVDEAIKLPTSDIEGKRAVAKRMEGDAATADESADALADYADEVTEMPLPETAAGGEGFTVQIEVNDELHRSDTQFAVGEDSAPDAATPRPGATSRPSPGGPTSQPTRTTTPADSGAPGGEDATAEAGGTASEPGTSDLTVIRSSTATPRSSAVGTVPTAEGGTVPTVVGVPTREVDLVAQTGREPAQEVGQPTWTVPPSRIEPGPAPREGDSGEPRGDASGPNPVVLVGGAVVLALMAIWFRRRL